MKTLITLFLIGITQSIFAYPITPRPLRKLIMESEYIVYAEVLKTDAVKTKDHWSDTKATLVIKEVLQGKINKSTLEVFFSKGIVCPAPAYYQKGTMVLAFLNQREAGGYLTHALSYGSKTINQSTFEVYKKRIIEMQSILEMHNEEEKTTKTIDWLISCAIDPDTRWEGIYELSPESDFMSYYDQGIFIQKYTLSDHQRSRLRGVLLQVQDFTYADIGLVDLVVKENDTELLDFLTKKVKETKLEELWYKDFLMERIAYFSNREDLKEIISWVQEIDYLDPKREEKTNALYRSFIEKL